MYKCFRVRLYPNKSQEELLWKHINSCRFLWNYLIDLQQKRYQNGEKYLDAFGMIHLLPALKNDGEHEWLKEVSNASLGHICRDLDRAYVSFFKKKTRYPKFKSKKTSKMVYPLSTRCLYFLENKIKVPKIGFIKFKTDYTDFLGYKENQIHDPRISNVMGKWYIGFSIECESQTFNLSEKSMGIDLGVKDLAIVAFGDEKIVYGNINKSLKMRKMDKRIRSLQHALSRKYEANKVGGKYVKTKNILKLEAKIRKLFYRQECIRDNYNHQVTHELVSLLPRKVVMEHLNVMGLLKNKIIGKAILAQRFSDFTIKMRYKCEERGIEFVQADMFYPSSKTCSNCGCVNTNLKLSDRIFKCPHCGFEIDRDYNAAINLMRYEAH
jgi:putative transposase